MNSKVGIYEFPVGIFIWNAHSTRISNSKSQSNLNNPELTIQDGDSECKQ